MGDEAKFYAEEVLFSIVDIIFYAGIGCDAAYNTTTKIEGEKNLIFILITLKEFKKQTQILYIYSTHFFFRVYYYLWIMCQFLPRALVEESGRN